MNAIDSIFYLPKPLRAAAYFGLQQAIGARIFGAWRDFFSWTALSPEELNARVEQKLGNLLRRALRHCEHYRALGIEPSPGENAFELLQKFPPLTRNEVGDDFARLVADPLRGEIPSAAARSPRRYDWLVVQTGGSTGAPTSVVHDAAFRDAGRATRLFAQRLSGFPLGTRYFRLWGSEQDLLRQKENPDRLLLRNLLGEIPLNAFRSKEADLHRHYQTLRRYPGIRYLMAYVDAAVVLASFIQEKKLPPPKLESIMACAGTVTPDWRRILQDIFGAEVFDKYGSRECADLACECSVHDGLHVFSPHAHLEIVDDQNRPCAPGAAGRLLVTLLGNASFPLIRYEIGDLAVWAPPSACPCGLPFPRLQSLQGRPDELLVTEDGTLLSSVFVRHFVGVSLNRQLIRQWQFEQVGPKEFIFRYVARATDGLAENLRDLRASFRAALGQSIEIQMEETPEIPPSPSGKTVWIKNRMRARPALSARIQK